MIKRRCAYCGKEFEIEKNTVAKYCSILCRNRRNNHMQRQQEKIKRLSNRTKLNAAVTDIAREAKEAGMSYGQYVARMGGK